MKLQAQRVVQRNLKRADAGAPINKMYYLVTQAPIERIPEEVGEVVSIVVHPDATFFDVEEEIERT